MMISNIDFDLNILSSIGKYINIKNIMIIW